MAQANILPARPNLDFLRKLAKERLKSLRADRSSAKLTDAQFLIAREYGFSSWQKLQSQIKLQRAGDQIDSLLDALRQGDVQTARRMIQSNPALANMSNSDGESPLTLAAERNLPEIIEILLEQGADPNAKFGQSAHNALSWAITVHSRDAVRALLAGGVKPDFFCAAGIGDVALIRSFFDNHGDLRLDASQTGSSRFAEDGSRLPRPPTTERELVSDALYIACRGGHADAVRELLRHDPDLKFRAYIGGTPLHWAYFGNSPEAINLLLQAGADPTLRDTFVRCTPRAFGICVAASWGITNFVTAQLARDPGLANIHEGRGTPLHEAARGGHSNVARILLEAGADPLIRDAQGKTATELAADHEHPDMVVLLGITAKGH